jgi:UDP-2,4-diacetamido-2,4,6-trideoxy-beta-L-altropyranose hydrolase
VGSKGHLIYIRLNAGHKIGMGHLFRMMQLAKLFIANGYNINFIINKNQKSEKILLDNGLKYFSYSTKIREDEIIIDSVNVMKPFAWIYDILNTKTSWVNYLKDKNIKVICFDDLKGGIISPADIIINPIVGCWQNNTNNDNIPLYSGPSYSILSSEVKNYRKKRKLNSDNINIGVTMGGSDTYGATVIVAKLLKKVRKDITVHFFLGPSFKHSEQLLNTLTNNPYKFEIYNFTKNLLGKLNNMDVVICGGGLTLFEVCAMGLPSMALANELHEIETINYFESKGATINIGYLYDINSSRFKDKINTLFIGKNNNIKKLSQNAFNMEVNFDIRKIFEIIEDNLLMNYKE